MTTRRDQRQTHVRPRPPSNGRPAPVRVKPRSPGPARISNHRPIERGRGTPIIARLALVALVAALGVGVLYVGMAGFGTAVGSLGSTLTGFLGNVTATPTPKPTILVPADAPSLALPTEPYTAESTVDLQVTVPKALVGDPDYKIRVYMALPDQSPNALQDVPLSDLQQTVIPVELNKGINDFSVTLVGPGGESEASAVARFVLDATPPKITISSPKNGAVVNRPTVDIRGKTQARTTLIARNGDNGSTFTATAGADGSFVLTVAIATGSNDISITATDPAGNASEATLSVRRGSGKLTASLSASTYQVKRSQLPEPVTLSATVTDPDGRPLANAPITFTLSMPGIPTVTRDTTTNSSGKASFATTIPKGADIGQGSATILVSSGDFGSTQDYTVISIVK
jgi:hypothetical protein